MTSGQRYAAAQLQVHTYGKVGVELMGSYT